CTSELTTAGQEAFANYYGSQFRTYPADIVTSEQLRLLAGQESQSVQLNNQAGTVPGARVLGTDLQPKDAENPVARVSQADWEAGMTNRGNAAKFWKTTAGQEAFANYYGSQLRTYPADIVTSEQER